MARAETNGSRLSTLTGTYAQTSSGLLGIASEALGFSHLAVDGDVTFASGATLEVDVKNGGQHCLPLVWCC